MSSEESSFWYSLGFDPFDPADWAAMSNAAADNPDIAYELWLIQQYPNK
jgi:hypothetical protein